MTRTTLGVVAPGALIAFAAIGTTSTQPMPTEPRDGKPPAGSKVSVENLYEQVIDQRTSSRRVLVGRDRATDPGGAGGAKWPDLAWAPS